MGKTTKKVQSCFRDNALYNNKVSNFNLALALEFIAEGVDEQGDRLADLIKNSHNIQMVSDSLEGKKDRAFMIIIEKMVARYQNRHADDLDEEIFKLFEKAKNIKWATTETDFQSTMSEL
ncbi:MAG TPA: hypothetical protein VJH05_01445 [Candidatus Paceibacterota bacterium]